MQGVGRTNRKGHGLGTALMEEAGKSNRPVKGVLGGLGMGFE